MLPDGLTGLHRKTSLGLITHNRWIDPASPYHQDYQISGIAAVDRNGGKTSWVISRPAVFFVTNRIG